MKTFSITLFVFFLCVFSSPAQVPNISKAQISSELEKRGLEEDVVRKKLLDRGIDVDNIQPPDLPKLETALEEINKEIEMENKAKLEEAKKETVDETLEVLEEKKEEIINEEVKEISSETAEDVIDAVKDGATVEEAIAEGILEAQEEEDLPEAVIYGQHIFRNKEITVRERDQINAPDSYILGPGDKISISIWGASEFDETFEIKPEGFIKANKMPRISLKGITYGRAKELLFDRFSDYYRFGNGQFEASLSYSRTITVNIVGEVMNPGGITIPAVNTAFNALAAAGGPSDIGSVRNITLISPGGATKKLDVYEYLLNTSVAEGYYLQDGDYIHVGTAERIVSIKGAVRKAFKFELLKNEDLNELIKYAGGLNPNAYQSNLQVKRYLDDEEKIVDVDFREITKTGRDFSLQSGDVIVVGVIPKPYQNFVEVIGAVDLPGKYQLDNGMSVRDLARKGTLADFARTDVAYLLRTNNDGTLTYERLSLDDALNAGADNLKLQPKDKLVVYSNNLFQDDPQIVISGAVRNPSNYDYDQPENLKVEDLILLGGGLRRDAAEFGYIYRTLDPANPNEKEYIRVDLQKVLNDPESAENFTLQPNDRLEVFSKLTDLEELTVGVRGAVRNPGNYSYDESLKLRDALTLSGGLKISASKKRIEVFRMILSDDANNVSKTNVATVEVDENMNLASGGEFELQPFDEIVVRSMPGFKYQQYVSVEGEVKYPGPYALLDDNERLINVIKRAGGVTAEAFPEGATLYREAEGTGYIVLRLDKVMENEKDRHNFILKKGDVINIPESKDLVTITGATRAIELYSTEIARAGKFNVAFNPGKRAKWYINEYAAGVGDKGRRRLITVEHPNGKLEKTKDFFVFKIYPKVRKGSVVKVGNKPIQVQEEGEAKEKIDWGKVLADSVAQATAVLSLILLLERVN